MIRMPKNMMYNTLIVLFFVIALLGSFMFIGMPITSPMKGKQLKRKFHCASNLKLLGTYLIDYADDFAGQLPVQDNEEGWQTLNSVQQFPPDILNCLFEPGRNDSAYFYFGDTVEPSQRRKNDIVAMEKYAHPDICWILLRNGDLQSISPPPDGIVAALTEFYRGDFSGDFRQKQLLKAKEWESSQPAENPKIEDNRTDPHDVMWKIWPSLLGVGLLGLLATMIFVKKKP